MPIHTSIHQNGKLLKDGNKDFSVDSVYGMLKEVSAVVFMSYIMFMVGPITMKRELH